MAEFVLSKELVQQIGGMAKQANAADAKSMTIFVPALVQLCDCFITAHDEILRREQQLETAGETIAVQAEYNRALFVRLNTLMDRVRSVARRFDNYPTFVAELNEAERAPIKEPFQEMVRDHVAAQLHHIYEQREEILAAFIVKYGCQPDEVVQVSSPYRWWIERRVPA